MSNRIVKLAALSLPLLFAQGVFAAEDTGFGYDTYYQFGYSRPVQGSTSETKGHASPQSIGYEVDYVYGSNARMVKPEQRLSTAQQRDVLGAQSGA